MVMKASYPSGTKRSGFEELKEANNLRAEISGLPPTERAKAESEINRLEQRKDK
jgi:hypothetical protein